MNCICLWPNYFDWKRLTKLRGLISLPYTATTVNPNVYHEIKINQFDSEHRHENENWPKLWYLRYSWIFLWVDVFFSQLRCIAIKISQPEICVFLRPRFDAKRTLANSSFSLNEGAALWLVARTTFACASILPLVLHA